MRGIYNKAVTIIEKLYDNSSVLEVRYMLQILGKV